MATDKEVLLKGIKYLAGALPLLFLGPVIMYSAFGNQDKFLFWPIFILSIFICIAAGYLIYKGITTMLKGLFND